MTYPTLRPRRNPPASPAPAPVEALEARLLLHAGHEHAGTDPVSAPAGAQATIRVNVAGGAFTDTAGNVWGPDAGFVNGTRSNTPYDVGGTPDDPLYYDRRFGNSDFAAAVPGGAYAVRLLFADPVYTAPGRRVFDVLAEGRTVLDDLDLAASGGGRAAVTRSFTVDVTDGTLNLAFRNVVENAIVSGIEIAPAGGVGSPGAPPAPTGAGARPLSPSIVRVSWAEGATDEAGFQLERASGSGPFALIGSAGRDQVNFDDAPVQSGVAYRYRVRTVSTANVASGYSNEAGASTVAATAPPIAPTDATAAALSQTLVRVRWTDRSNNEEGFQVERAIGNGPFTLIGSAGPDQVSFDDAGRTPNTTYRYRARAVNTVGPSGATGEAAVTTPGATTQPPPPPTSSSFTTVNWSPRAAAPIPRAEALRAVVDGKLYVFAGFSGNAGPVVRSDVYDPATNAWTRIADHPRRLTHAGTTAVGRDVYFAGGYVGTGPGFQQQFGTREVWKYNVDANAYARLPDLPIALASGGLTALGRELHYFSGNNAARQDVADHYVLNLDNPAAGWSARAPLPGGGRSHFGYVALAGQIWAVGGQVGNDEALTTRALVHAYDPATNSWTQKASLPKAISHVGSATFVMGGRILVAGGETAHNAAVADVFAYDPAADRWTALTPLPAPRFSGVGAAIGDAIYFTGGSNQTTTYRGTPG